MKTSRQTLGTLPISHFSDGGDSCDCSEVSDNDSVYCNSESWECEEYEVEECEHCICSERQNPCASTEQIEIYKNDPKQENAQSASVAMDNKCGKKWRLVPAHQLNTGKSSDMRFCKREIKCLMRSPKYKISIIAVPKGYRDSEVIAKPMRIITTREPKPGKRKDNKTTKIRIAASKTNK